MYHILPFNFTSINNKELLVNEVGDYLIVEKGTVKKVLDRNVHEDSELYKDLHSNFFISEHAIPQLIDNYAARYRTKKAFLDDFTSLHIFVLTLRCNQNCQYCQVSSKICDERLYDISYTNLNYAIDLMFESPSPTITMEFQGGEPTLLTDKFIYSIERVEELNKIHNKKITYVLCTNSIDLSDKLINVCKDYQVLISTSLDGPEFIHDSNRNREGSFDLVIKGINKARTALGYNQVSALMTTSNMSLNYPEEIIDSYIENGFSNIFLRALNPYGYAKDNIWNEYFKKFVEFYKRSLDYIIEINKKGVFFIEDFTALILKKILTPFPIGFVDLQSPAGLINSVIVYNYDGFIYASDESRMLAEHGDYSFRLGKLGDEYNSIFYGAKAQEIAMTWSNEALVGCSDCAFQSYCGADPVRNHSSQSDMEGFRPTSHFCYKHKAIISHIFQLLDDRGEEVLPIFKSWIS